MTTHVPHTAIAGVASLNGALWRIALSPLVNPPMMPPMPVPPPHVTPSVNQADRRFVVSSRAAIEHSLKPHYDALRAIARARRSLRSELWQTIGAEVERVCSAVELHAHPARGRSGAARARGRVEHPARARASMSSSRALRDDPRSPRPTCSCSPRSTAVWRARATATSRASWRRRSACPTRSASRTWCSRTIWARASTASQNKLALAGTAVLVARAHRGASRTSTCPSCATSSSRRRSGSARSARSSAGSPARGRWRWRPATSTRTPRRAGARSSSRRSSRAGERRWRRSDGALLVGGDLNTTTYDLSSPLALARNLLHKLFVTGFDDTVEQYMTPELRYEQPVFDVLARARARRRRVQRLRSSGTLTSTSTTSTRCRRRGLVGGALTRLLVRLLRPWNGCVPARLDWFAGRGVDARRARRRSIRGPLASDHAAIVVDLSAVTLIWFTLLIGVLITVHELGHFVMARLFGVRVRQAGHRLRPAARAASRAAAPSTPSALIPLGGYVRLCGEEPRRAPSTPRRSRSPFRCGRRGSAWPSSSAGRWPTSPSPRSSSCSSPAPRRARPARPSAPCSPGSPPPTPTLRPGDRVVAVDDESVHAWDDFNARVLQSPGRELRITVERAPRRAKRRARSPSSSRRACTCAPIRSAARERVGLIGVAPYFKLPQIGVVGEDSPRTRRGCAPSTSSPPSTGGRSPPSSELDPLVHPRGSGMLVVTYLRPVDAALGFVSLALLSPRSAQVVPRQRRARRASRRATTPGVRAADSFVHAVEPGTPAAAIGLGRGDMVTQLDGQPVTSWELLTQSLDEHPVDEHTIAWHGIDGIDRHAELPARSAAAARRVQSRVDLLRLRRRRRARDRAGADAAARAQRLHRGRSPASRARRR